MNVTPIGGKTPSSTVAGVAVDADGKLVTKKAWTNDVILAYEMTELPTTTDTIRPPAVDVSDCGAFSLRVENTTDAEYSIGFYSDTTTNGVSLKKADDGTSWGIRIPANLRFIAITPDDMPIMQWIRDARLYILPRSVPTSGTLRVWIVKKV